VLPGADYKLVELDAAHQATLKDVTSIARHPEFDANAALRHRVTADVALLKVARLGEFRPQRLAPAGASVAVGDLLRGRVATASPSRPTARAAARLRTAALVATGQPGTLQIRLSIRPPMASERGSVLHGRFRRAGCFRDNGGRLMVIGVVKLVDRSETVRRLRRT